MYDLFNPPPNSLTTFDSLDMNHGVFIPGLKYVPNFITHEEEITLIHSINSEPWLPDIKRRVQHYGYKYDYKARSINYGMFLGALPHWVTQLADRLFRENFIEEVPDQLIVNEYIPGQGIANHVDCVPCFGDTIISISLGSCCVMDFIHEQSKQKIEVMLEPRSMVVINGDSRHLWTHGISQRRYDVFKGQKFQRKLRISMTFRKVLLK